MDESISDKLAPFIGERLSEGMPREAVGLALIGAAAALFAPVDSPVPDNDELVETFLRLRLAFPFDREGGTRPV